MIKTTENPIPFELKEVIYQPLSTTIIIETASKAYHI